MQPPFLVLGGPGVCWWLLGLFWLLRTKKSGRCQQVVEICSERGNPGHFEYEITWRIKWDFCF